MGIRQPIDMSMFRPRRGGRVDAALAGERQVYFGGAWQRARVFRRNKLPAGARFAGPAIVEQLDSTLVLDPGAQAEVDDLGNILVIVEPQEASS